MATRALQQVICYYAWNTSTNVYVTGDSANHSTSWCKDGTRSATTNATAEVDATNLPGLYKVTMTATETDCIEGVLGGKSSTGNVVLIGTMVAFDYLNTSAPATAGIPDVNMKNIANAAVSASAAQIGVNVVNIAGSASLGAAGAVAPDWGAVQNKATTNALTGTTISTSQAIASVSGAVGSVTGNVGGSVGSVTAAVTVGTMNVATIAAATFAAGAITTAAFAAGAITAAVTDSTFDNAIADALLDRANAIETGITLRQAMRYTASACVGVLAGASTTTVTISGINQAGTNRITATVDASGNRSAVTLA